MSILLKACRIVLVTVCGKSADLVLGLPNILCIRHKRFESICLKVYLHVFSYTFPLPEKYLKLLTQNAAFLRDPDYKLKSHSSALIIGT